MSVRHDVFSNEELLTPPGKRPAWSDRTALLMAEMSKVAYYKFEVDANDRVMLQADLDIVLKVLISGVAPAAGTPPPPEGAVKLEKDLAKAGFELAGLFSNERTDTQAFLATSIPGSGIHAFGSEEVVILSFRGTKTAKDWLTNVKFYQKDDKFKATHAGFQDAFESVREDIQGKLVPLVKQGRIVFVTGHSLGEALAILATRSLAPDSGGACYTFGSPRLGRFGFAQGIKTPIYRVRNANDIVPRVPSAYLPYVILWTLRALNAFGLFRAAIKKVTRYVHYGDMRFMRRTKGSDDDIQVLSNPSELYRFFWFWRAFAANWRSPVKNHDINLYCQKLAAYAVKRNK